MRNSTVRAPAATDIAFAPDAELVSRPGLTADFYRRPVLTVARELIGCAVVCGDCAGVIVETEAYHQSEPACHAFVGLTPRTATLFGPPGRAYVYRSYGIHVLLNAVCEDEGVGAGVLFRAIEPVTGIELMAERRGRSATELRELCSGPGKLTQALGVTLSDHGCSLTDGRVRIVPPPAASGPPAVQAGRRIGISKATELPWRFVAAGSKFISAPLRAPQPGWRGFDAGR
jgi:DNA-3-methyladenine glycosylase